MKCPKKHIRRDWIKSKQTPWFSTSELLEYLGIAQKELSTQIKLFTEGIHYIRTNPNDPSSEILWRIDLVDEL